jgi:hypothetical protein
MLAENLRDLPEHLPDQPTRHAGRRREPALLSLLGTAILVTMVTGLAQAQIDPEPRANLEVGAEGPARGDGPLSGYFFLLWNQPKFLHDDQYLRVIVAPGYLTSELVWDQWPGRRQAVGIGLGGGYTPYDFNDFRNGGYKERESFHGSGGETFLTYYPRSKIAGVMPIEAQIRFRPRYVLYERGNDTDSRFRLPADTPIYYGRVGLRIGGEPPELLPQLALELSLWHEVAYRQVADSFGFLERPQGLEHLTQESWGRVGGVVTVGKYQTARVFLTAGAAENTDALSTFRLGSALVFRDEFPLILHGYFVNEIFARRFWLLNLGYRFPLVPDSDKLQIQLSADIAQVDYFSGHRLPRSTLRGGGIDVSIRLTPRLTLVTGYGYGVDARRNGTYGGHELNMALEWKLIAPPASSSPRS